MRGGAAPPRRWSDREGALSGSGPKLGKLIEGFDPPRDAIHMAVIPVVAGERLKPSESVVMKDGKAFFRTSGPAVGIVDPWLDVEAAEPGQRFWLLLRPGTITALRHEWSHPTFPTPEGATDTDKAASAEWMNEFIGEWWKDEKRVPMWQEVLGELISKGWVTTYGHSITSSEVDDEFWFHAERLTGRRFTAEERENTTFSCVC